MSVTFAPRFAPRPTTQVFGIDSGVVIHAGGDDFLTIDLPADEARELVAVLRGDLEVTACARLDPGLAADIAAELCEDGLLVADGPADGSEAQDARGHRIAVVGHGRVADAVRTLLGPRDRAESPGDTGDTAALELSGTDGARRFDLVIACAGWLPDAAWLEFDARCLADGVAWTRCWGDGSALFLGPTSVPGFGPGYDDVRRRQLAATDSPELLLGLWRHWDQGQSPYPEPDHALAAVAAGHLVADLGDLIDLGDLGDRALPLGATHQREIDLATRRVDLHPILPTPSSPWWVAP